jgi:hypothetical protein
MAFRVWLSFSHLIKGNKIHPVGTIRQSSFSSVWGEGKWWLLTWKRITLLHNLKNIRSNWKWLITKCGEHSIYSSPKYKRKSELWQMTWVPLMVKMEDPRWNVPEIRMMRWIGQHNRNELTERSRYIYCRPLNYIISSNSNKMQRNEMDRACSRSQSWEMHKEFISQELKETVTLTGCKGMGG